MILSTSLRLGCLFTTHSQSLYAVPIRLGHWFSKYDKIKKPMRPISKAVLKKYKDTVKEKLPDAKAVPSLLSSYLDDSTPESVKKIYSFEHLGLEVAIEEVIKEKLELVGLEPTDDGTAAEIVKLTVRLRVLREQAPIRWNKAMERRLLEMIEKRQLLVQRLRSENYEQFLLVLQQLQLHFEHERPPHLIPPRPGFSERLEETRQRCHQLKLRRLRQLQERLEAETEEFERRRDAQLKEAEAKLQQLGLKLPQLLQEVRDDRQLAAKEKLLEDRLRWYYGEQWARRRAAERLEAKRLAAAASARK